MTPEYFPVNLSLPFLLPDFLIGRCPVVRTAGECGVGAIGSQVEDSFFRHNNATVSVLTLDH